MNKNTDLSKIAAHVTLLEEQLSFQQRAIEELNEVVLAQQAELDRQGCELISCRKLMGEFVERHPDEDLPHEKPPHY
jgi:uncharacterized coiled-coil protein SlyX